jgi:asparagine synthase (glutamine-hydrolysing)
MKLGTGYTMRTMLKTFFPSFEFYLRKQSRQSRREIIEPALLKDVQNELVQLYKYNSIYNVWRESLYGVHLPHLVHYDDRNAMAKSIEGRMPFLDHRIVEFVASIRPDDLLKKGMRKFILRESCKQYIPRIVYERKDKIGFYTPLISMLAKDKEWVADKLKGNRILTEKCASGLMGKLGAGSLNVNDALQIWRSISVSIWKKEFNINSQS